MDLREPPCLHCSLRDAVMAHYAAIGSRAIVIDVPHTLKDLARVAGELIASAPEAMRDELLGDFATVLREAVDNIAASGKAPIELMRLS